MPSPDKLYTDGYEKGKQQTLGGAAAEVMFAHILRDDPAGHFMHGYQDAIHNRPFSLPKSAFSQNRRSDGMVPKFSDNPLGWFVGICILIELWAIWQLVKAPFQLIGTTVRNEKPSSILVAKNLLFLTVSAVLLWIHFEPERRAEPHFPNGSNAVVRVATPTDTVSTTGADGPPTSSDWGVFFDVFSSAVSSRNATALAPLLSAKFELANEGSELFYPPDRVLNRLRTESVWKEVEHALARGIRNIDPGDFGKSRKAATDESPCVGCKYMVLLVFEKDQAQQWHWRSWTYPGD